MWGSRNVEYSMRGGRKLQDRVERRAVAYGISYVGESRYSAAEDGASNASDASQIAEAKGGKRSRGARHEGSSFGVRISRRRQKEAERNQMFHRLKEKKRTHQTNEKGNMGRKAMGKTNNIKRQRVV